LGKPNPRFDGRRIGATEGSGACNVGKKAFPKVARGAVLATHKRGGVERGAWRSTGQSQKKEEDLDKWKSRLVGERDLGVAGCREEKPTLAERGSNKMKPRVEGRRELVNGMKSKRRLTERGRGKYEDSHVFSLKECGLGMEKNAHKGAIATLEFPKKLAKRGRPLRGRERRVSRGNCKKRGGGWIQENEGGVQTGQLGSGLIQEH